MKLTTMLLLGGAGYLGYKFLLGGAQHGCTDTHIKTIAGIYGMPVAHVGVRVPSSPGAQGGVEIYDKRNGAGMIHVLGGNCGAAAMQASTAVAQAGGNKMFPNKPYDGSLFVIS